MTSYWTGDEYGSGSVTGSGKKTTDFQVNENGWYTYQGKLVIATATPYLLNNGWAKYDGIIYYNYYDVLTLIINGQSYEAIVLDSCGACMSRAIIDLFVVDRAHSLTTSITVK